MNFSTLDNVLWATSLVGHVALVLVLVLRKEVRKFPVFTFFVTFEAFRTVLLFLVLRLGTKHGYFVVYWLTGFADYVLQVALILEIARIVLRPTGTWVSDARNSFIIWGGAGLLAAAVLSLSVGPPEAKGFDLWDARITIFTCLLTCELFLAMSVAANRLGLQRRSHVVALGQGLTIWAVVALLGNLGHVAFGWNQQFMIFDHLRMFAYLGSLLFWIVAFWLPERQRAPLSGEMQHYLLALHTRVQYDLDRISR